MCVCLKMSLKIPRTRFSPPEPGSSAVASILPRHVLRWEQLLLEGERLIQSLGICEEKKVTKFSENEVELTHPN